MDVQGIAIGLGVFILSAIIIYAISALTMREKTFEQVMAEQRSRQQAVQQSKPKQERKDKKKKRPKSKAKAEDAVPQDVADAAEVEDNGHATEDEHKMVQYELEPEIIEPQVAATVETTRHRKKKAKPILVNKDEKVLVKDNLKADEEPHRIVPLDDVELKHERQRRDSQHSTGSNEPRVTKKEEKKPVDEEIMVAQAAAPAEQIPPTKKQKKQKSANSGVGDGSEGSLVAVMKAIQSAALSEADTQTLLDSLLSKQGQEWTRKPQKGDPVAAMKKQLEEREKTIADQQVSMSGMAEKLKSLKQEALAEKQRLAASEQQCAMHRDEIQSMHARMQQTHEQHGADVNALRLQREQYQVSQNQMSVLMEENRQLKEANARACQVDVTSMQKQIKMLQDELNNSALRYNQLENAKEISDRKLSKCEDQIRELRQQADSSNMLATKLNEVNEELRRTQVQKDGLSRDLDKIADDKKRADQELANLRNTLKNVDSTRSSAEEEIRTIQAKLEDMTKENASLHSKVELAQKQNQEQSQELKGLQQEKEILNTEVATLKERAELQQSSAEQNTAPAVDDVTQKQLQEAQQTLSEREAEIGQLQSSIQSMTNEISGLRSDMESQKEKNDALRKRNWKAMDALSEAEKRAEKLYELKRDLENKDSKIVELQKELAQTQINAHALESKYDSLKTEADRSVEGTRTELTTARRELQEKAAELEEFKKQTEQKLNQESQEMQKESAKSSALWQQLQDLQQDIAAKETALQKLHAEAVTLKKNNQDLEVARKDAQAVVSAKEALEQKVASLETALQSKEAELQSLGDSVDTLRKHNSNLERQKDEALDSHFGEVETLNAEIANLQSKLEEKSCQVKELEKVSRENNDLQAKVEIAQASVSPGVKTDPPGEELNEQFAFRGFRIEKKSPEIDKLTEIVKEYYLENSELKERLETLENAKDAEAVSSKESELTIANRDAQITQMSEEITVLKQQIQSQQGTIHEFETKVASKDSQLSDMDSKLQASHSDVRDTASKLSDLQVQLERMASHDGKMHSMQEQLDSHKQTITDLESRNESLEHSIEDRLSKAKKEASRNYEELLKRLHPEVDVQMTSSSSEWMHVFEKQARQQMSSFKTNGEASQEDARLQAEVEHYKSVLSNTEDILKRLQSSVESEEKRWMQKLKNSEQELRQARDEVKRMKSLNHEAQGSKEDLTDLDFAYRCVEKSLSNIVDEMEDRVKELEVKLVSAESEKATLSQELSAMKLRVDDLEKNSPSGGSNQQIVKLKAQVKFGEDALKQEQELVQQLQEQLSKQKQSMANGTSPVVDETKELRAQLLETQKQLDREVHSNKQLMQRLVASVASEGTSV